MEVRQLGDGEKVFSSVTYSGDSRFLAAASDERKIYLWNAQTFERVAVLPPQDRIAGFSLNEDGTWLAAGSGKEVRIWETHGGLLHSLPVGQPVWRTDFSPRGDLLAVAHKTGVEIWDARAGSRLHASSFPVEFADFQIAFRCDGGAAVWGNASRAGAGPWRNPPLGFYSLEEGGVLTSIGEARTAAAAWAFTKSSLTRSATARG